MGFENLYGLFVLVSIGVSLEIYECDGLIDIDGLFFLIFIGW